MDFLERIHARPAYRRALERGGEYELVSWTESGSWIVAVQGNLSAFGSEIFVKQGDWVVGIVRNYDISWDALLKPDHLDNLLLGTPLSITAYYFTIKANS